jgi:diacylglycerol O-acyltransferase-1
VHNWLVRHVYFPMRRRKIGKYAANIFIFFVSALFHEVCPLCSPIDPHQLLSSLPLSLIRFHFFWGMLFQSPMAVLTEMYTKDSQLGNFIFWIVFCIIGQPMILLLYYHDYLVVYGDPEHQS